MNRDQVREQIAGQLPQHQRELYERAKAAGMPGEDALGAACRLDRLAIEEAEREHARQGAALKAAERLDETDRMLFDGFREAGDSPTLALSMLHGRPEDQPRNATMALASAVSEAGRRRDAARPTFAEIFGAPADSRGPSADDLRALRRSVAFDERVQELMRSMSLGEAIERAERELLAEGHEPRRVELQEAMPPASFTESQQRRLRELLATGLGIREALDRVEAEG